MTLGRLALGFLAVTALFAGVAWVSGRRTWAGAGVAAVESLVLTLLAALWFGALGSGGWLLVFTLVGVVASGAERWNRALEQRAPMRPLVAPTVFVTVRYIVAGGILSVILT